MTIGERTPPSDPPHFVPPAFRPDPRHQYRPNEALLRARSLFSTIPIFRDVPPHHLRQLAQAAHRQHYAAGDTIIRMGESGSTMHVISSGRVQVVLERPGEDVELATLGPGEFFGELSIFDGEQRSASVIAIEETETLTLDHIDIVRLLNRSPELALSLLKALSGRLRMANARSGATPFEASRA
jgi:CRP/FNR family transcriptional regulator/CRP/FNR family cyclic AMP-dependent transcriptional regulator